MRKKQMRLFRCAVLFLATVSILRGTAVYARAQAPVYRSVKNESMKIAITFDDGPHPHLTQEILDILEQYHVKATFFMVGVNVVNYPDAARAVLQAGHEVGNHTYSHSDLKHMDELQMRDELGLCEDVLEELCEYRPHLFRPPEGVLNAYVEHCSANNDYSLILWSLDTRDWESKDTDKIVKRVLSQVCAGDIILMHDYIGHNSKTPEALRVLLPKLLELGYEPVTVSELLGAE